MRVAVLAGGRSSEHNVSLDSGATVGSALEEAGHDAKRAGTGPLLVFAARATSAGVSGMRPARLTKYGPSGTSSTVLMFLARCPRTGSPGVAFTVAQVWPPS